MYYRWKDHSGCWVGLEGGLSGCEENTWEAAAVDQEGDGGTGAAPVAAEKKKRRQV